MDTEAAFVESKGEVAQMAARTSYCRLKHEEYANGVRAWRSGFHGFRFEPWVRRDCRLDLPAADAQGTANLGDENRDDQDGGDVLDHDVVQPC